MEDLLHTFFRGTSNDVSEITNERALQLELAYYFRTAGVGVQFEKYFDAARLPGSTCKPKVNLDLFLTKEKKRIGIEIKVPLNGKHPETLYDFCADIEFIEALLRVSVIEKGYCVLLTNDPVFWKDTGRGSPIHNCFRCHGNTLSGPVNKPTGQKDTAVVLSGRYIPSVKWQKVGDARLMRGAQYLIIEASLQ